MATSPSDMTEKHICTHMLPSLNMSAKDDQCTKQKTTLSTFFSVWSFAEISDDANISDSNVPEWDEGKSKEESKCSTKLSHRGEIYVSTVMLENIKEYYLDVTKFGFHSDTSCTTSLGLVSQICQQLVTDS